MESFWDLFNPEELIRYGGLTLIVLIVFAENGLFFGFFLPGDSLLFTAGLLCHNGVLDVSLPVLLLLIFTAAVLGYFVGYAFGWRAGESLFSKEDSLFFKKKYVYTAQDFYARFGGMALVMGRFLPIVRTFAPIFAGVAMVKLPVFIFYNILGAAVWAGTVVSAGYFLSQLIPNLQHYLEYIIIGLIVITAIPVLRTYTKYRRQKTEQAEQKKKDFSE